MKPEDRNVLREDAITTMQTQLGKCVLDVERKSGQRVYVDIAAEALEAASHLMLDRFGSRFQIATGVDTRDGFEVMYHWALDDLACVITLRILLDHAKPELNSIALICPAAEWIEREMWELLGINFLGHPDLRHLLLSDDWPEDNYPMRRNHGTTS
jgi:Ni,Fe-hydrogenase III component G